ncbi:MAG: Rpn family recombination-promoting nuclease/putative transposase [Candidatus Ozemobacteraceae bacterium]
MHLVDDKLKEYYSDLLFTIQTKASLQKVCIYILFEHKCQSERLTVLQVLGYILRIWEKLSDGTGKLPVVRPLIFLSWNQNMEFPFAGCQQGNFAGLGRGLLFGNKFPFQFLNFFHGFPQSLILLIQSLIQKRGAGQTGPSLTVQN